MHTFYTMDYETEEILPTEHIHTNIAVDRYNELLRGLYRASLIFPI